MMKSVLCTCIFCFLMVTTGCGSKNGSTEQGSTAAHSHPHPHPHEHGASKKKDHSVQGHSHGVGPHGGGVVDWGGGKYHVELKIDKEQQRVTAYVLGSDEKTPTSISAESIDLYVKMEKAIVVKLNPQPMEQDQDGSASRFVGIEQLLSGVKEFTGTVTALIDGTPYSGDFD